MESTWFRIFMLLCFFALSSGQTASSASGAIKYLVDGVGGKSCDEVCQGQGFICKGTDHGMPSNVVATFKAAGVDCQFDEFDTSKDNWFHSADPKYGIGGLDDQVCRGFKNVPNEIKCDAKPAGNYGRLCPCIVAQTTTEAPTTAPQTSAAPTTTQSVQTTTGPELILPPVPSDGLTVKCSRDSMIAILDLMKFPNMDTGTMTLNDASCKATHVNDTHAIIETPLDGCGTTHNASEDYLHYYNNIKISRIKKNVSSDAIITRDHEALFPFQCSYDRKTVLSVVSFSPRMKLVYTREAEYGNFTFTMDMFKSDKYQKAYDEYPVLVKLGQRLYLEVKAESKDTKLVLFTQKCHATPTSDVNDKTSYSFIEDGCGVDKTLLYDYNNQSSFQRFSVASFRFLIGSTDRVHLHCEVVVCRKSDTESVCAKGCDRRSRRRRAAIGNPPREVLTVGPMDFVQVQTASGVAAGPVSVITIASIAAALGLLALVLIATLVIMYRRCQTPHGGKPVLLVQD